MTRSFALLALCACATVKPDMTYRSDRAVPKLPLKVNVEVKIAADAARPAENEEDFHPGDAIFLTQTLRDSLRADLTENGPFTVNSADAQGVLTVELGGRVVKHDATVGLWHIASGLFEYGGLIGGILAIAVSNDTALGAGLLAAGLGGGGVAMLTAPWSSVDFSLSATGQLWNARGDLIDEVVASADTSEYVGAFYNHVVDYGPATRALTEDLRAKLSAHSEEITARFAGKAPPLRLASGAAPPSGLTAAIAALPVPPPPPPSETATKCARPNKPTLALLDLAVNGFSKDEAGLFTEMLRSELVATNCFRLQDRAQMREVLHTQTANASDACDQSCAVQAGRLLQVSLLLTGTTMKTGDTAWTVATVTDVETGTVVKSARVKAASNSADAMVDALSQLARQLAQ